MKKHLKGQWVRVNSAEKEMKAVFEDKSQQSGRFAEASHILKVKSFFILATVKQYTHPHNVLK